MDAWDINISACGAPESKQRTVIQPRYSAILSCNLPSLFSPLAMCNLGFESLYRYHQPWCSSNCQSAPASLHKQMATFIQRSHTQGQERNEYHAL